MYDSSNIYSIPTGVEMVGFYVDGFYAFGLAEVRARFPASVLVPISAIGTNAGVVGDVEPGCMTPAQSVDWVLARRAAGVDPTIYCNFATQPAVIFAFGARGVELPNWWLAGWDGIADIAPDAVAEQYANPTFSGGHFDLSLVRDFWPGIDNANTGGGGTLIGDHMDLSNPVDKAVYDNLNIIHDGLFKKDPAAGILAADGSYVAIQDAIANTLTDVLALSKRVDGVAAAVAALKPAAAPDLSAIQASLTALNAKVDIIAARVTKDLA